MTAITPALEAVALLAIATETGRLARQTEIVDRTEQLERAGVPVRVLRAATAAREALERNEAITVAESWGRRQSGGTLMLYGKPGRGKTVAACRYAVVSRAQWVYAPKIGVLSFADFADELKRLTSVRHLVIDEIGGQLTTGPIAVERIACVLNERHGNMLHTVCTTNLDEKPFAQVYDGVDDPAYSRILARIREDGRWLACNWQDYRERPIDLDRARVDAARRFLQLVEHARRVELGSEPVPSLLAELARLMRVTPDEVAERAAACSASRERSYALVEGLLGRMRMDHEVHA
jgi:hypothetical protein